MQLLLLQVLQPFLLLYATVLPWLYISMLFPCFICQSSFQFQTYYNKIKIAKNTEKTRKSIIDDNKIMFLITWNTIKFMPLTIRFFSRSSFLFVYLCMCIHPHTWHMYIYIQERLCTQSEFKAQIQRRLPGK